jgi:hypothetical protein
MVSLDGGFKTETTNFKFCRQHFEKLEAVGSAANEASHFSLDLREGALLIALTITFPRFPTLQAGNILYVPSPSQVSMPVFSK